MLMMMSTLTMISAFFGFLKRLMSSPVAWTFWFPDLCEHLPDRGFFPYRQGSGIETAVCAFFRSRFHSLLMAPLEKETSAVTFSGIVRLSSGKCWPGPFPFPG